ncbi:hatching enzyme 1.2-like [Anoplolepis gracilipes]|uniref:hatching enzyme 1.2-like n=1 Tax=Anoplolepis gracilipes TaxID=354296 RepID=UPI003BA0298A
MQKAQYLRGSWFPYLTLVLLLGDWLVTDVNAQFLDSWKKPMLLPSKVTQTKRTPVINYRFDRWSQYDNPEEGRQREGDIHVSRQLRKTITMDKTLLWPNGVINYYVHSSIVNEPTKLTILDNALEIIMSKTCIKFVRIQEYEQLPVNNWVNITGHRKGCFSDLGRNAYGPTTLNLDVDLCFRTIGHTIHEMLHTLGAYHEHMRPDRDKYITILWKNIKKGNAFNFKILSANIVTDYGLPYDYDSIMHYSMTAFSINKTAPTIIPTSSPVEIGQRSHISYYDIQKLLISYNCSSSDTKNNFKSDKLKQNKYAKSERSTDRFDQGSSSVHFIQPDNYPVPLNPIYLYINFHFYFYKKNI